MTMQRHLLLIVGLLIAMAPAGIGQVTTAKPAQPVERDRKSVV